jgi:dolichol-phosphate mannosyltransferase
MKKLSVVFSFRNESEVLPELLKRVINVFLENKIYDYELIFVNDDSTDNSEYIIRQSIKNNKSIKLINMSKRWGGTPCILAGLRHSTGDAILHMDCDLQDPPELIPIMLHELAKGFDVVHTVRKTRAGEVKAKMALVKIAYRIIKFFSGGNLIENAGDFKMYSRRALGHLLSLKEFDPYMRGLSIWIGFPQSFIYYDRDERVLGYTKFKLSNSLNPYREFVRGITSYSNVPLLFSLYLGLIISIIAFLVIIYVLYNKFLGNNIPGWTAVISSILFIGGIILFNLGIIGLYIGRIYEQVKGRPQYIIKDEV